MHMTPQVYVMNAALSRVLSITQIILASIISLVLMCARAGGSRCARAWGVLRGVGGFVRLL